jgi:simple sugar transport system ATP-binding protein
MTAWRLEARGLVKRYPNGVLANDAVDLRLARGEIHALIGENGAGKSTLMKMLYGLEQPDAGTILLDGASVALPGPATAIAAGIGLVPQHVQLVPSFSVARNVVLGAEPRRGLLLDHGAAADAVRRLARQYGLAADPEAIVGTLSLGEQQGVGILKALYRGADLLMLDEPGAVLSPDESAALYTSLRALTRDGLTVLLITHKIADVLDVADRYTVLRGGRVAGQGSAATATAARVTELIAGVVPAPVQKPSTGQRRPARLRAEGLVLGGTVAAALDGVTLDVAPGEILGIAGVEGNGQSALAQVLAGAPLDGGTVGVDGVPYTGQGVRAALRHGVALVPEDRLHDGVAPDLSIAENAIAATYRAPPLSRHGWLRPGAVRAFAADVLARFGVRAAGPDQRIGALSGGNMQKIVLARALSSGPQVLIACQPTRGVDVGAADFLRRQLLALRAAGGAIVLISADLDEILALSDRIAVMVRGRIAGHFAGADATPQLLAAYMTGARSQPDARACGDAPFVMPDAPTDWKEAR